MAIDFKLIKNSVKIDQVVKFYGINLKNNKALCPFHSEKIPSFAVNNSKQIFNCFTCQVGGDAITFTARLFGLSNKDAAIKIDNDFLIGTTNQKLSRIDIVNIKRKQKIENEKKIKEEKYKEYKINIEEIYVEYDKITMNEKPAKWEEPNDLFIFATIQKNNMYEYLNSL